MIDLHTEELSAFKKHIVIKGALSEKGLCLMDSCAPHSLIDEKMAERIKAPSITRKIEITGISKGPAMIPLVEVVIEYESRQIRTLAGVYPLKELLNVDFIAGFDVFKMLLEQIVVF